MSRLVRYSLVWNWYSPSSGNVWRTRRPPTRAERQAIDVLVLRQILRHAIGVAAGPRRAIADGERADRAGRREIALLQRRRHAQHVRDVVEAVGRVVGRQQRRRIDVEASRSRMAFWYSARFSRCSSGRPGNRAAPRRRDPGSARAPRHERCIVASSGRRAPLRRHHARSQLADHLLPHLGVVRGVRDIRRPSSTRSPVLRRALWHVTQYWSIVAFGPGSGIRDPGSGVGLGFGVRDSGFGVRDSGFGTWNAGALVA